MSQLGKYLFYAIGEILLVVIGILIALQINNWNNHRVDRQMELEYLQRLMMDLYQDSIDIALNVERVEYKIETLSELNEAISKGSDLDESFVKNYRGSMALGWAVHEARSTAAYNEMVSSGHLRLIQSEELRRQLAIYYHQWEHDYYRANQRKSDYSKLIYQSIDLSREVDLSLRALLQRMEESNLSNEFYLQVRHEINYGDFLQFLFETLEKRRAEMHLDIAMEYKSLALN